MISRCCLVHDAGPNGDVILRYKVAWKAVITHVNMYEMISGHLF